MTHTKQLLSGMSDSGENISISNRSKKVFFLLFVSVLLIASVIGIVAVVNSQKNNFPESKTIRASTSHAILKSSCSSTLYPDLCFSAIASIVPETSNKISTHKDVIMISLNLTITAVQRTYFKVKKISERNNLTKREKNALHDCLEMIDVTIDELRKVEADLNEYPNKKGLTRHADDLKTLMSATITNQETCLDGFSYDERDKRVRDALLEDEVRVAKMCSNALAMIRNMTDADIAGEIKLTRRNNWKMKEEDPSGWPEWLSAGDRLLLQSSTVTPNIVVAADGSGNYLTVAAAVAAAPEKSSERYVIRIKAGVYRENVEVNKNKINIMFVGDGRMSTIITGSRNFVDGSSTFDSATVAAVGNGFLARDITFQNTAGPSKHQAVALRVGSDLSAFYRCNMLAYQDTLYVHSNRQFFVGCTIVGTVDFIFGNAAAVLQDCVLRPRKPNSGQKNMVTAQGRTDINQNTGIVIQKCRIEANSDLLPVQSSFPSYLGRPWKNYSRTVVMQSTITNVIEPAGWYKWDGDFALNTLVYREYKNTGEGADTSGRVNWTGYKAITDVAEAEQYTARKFIDGESWLASTTFPYSLGLS